MKSIIKILLICTSFVTASAYAATLNGSLAVGGAFIATGGSDLSDATGIDIDTIYQNPSIGDFSVINVSSDPDTGGSFGFDPFGAANNVFTIDGWTLDITTLNAFTAPTVTTLLLTGTGIISGNNFEATSANWSFSTSAGSGGSYSMTVTAVPVPAAVWLFGSGLIGLIGVARRKA